MGHYYLLLSLPPLSLKEPPAISFAELKESLHLNLSARDEKHVASLFEEIDLYNIKAFWAGLPLDPRGNEDLTHLEESLLVGDVPLFFADFLQKYPLPEERILHFAEAIAAFYREKEEKERGILQEWYDFERKRNLLLAALRAKKLERNLADVFKDEEASDPTVAFLLAQKDSFDLFLPVGWEELKVIFVENQREPKKMHRAILEYQLEKIEELEEKSSPFSLDQVFLYVLKFLIVQTWAVAQGTQGKEVVEKIVDGT
ncbi:MAG: DUF2764 family protein [Verrucomicrobiota bacterium]|nr:DUF2764 family protein [Verrucomicrobiota bacterium]